MTHDEFIETYNGTTNDYDKAFGFQCVDLARAYCDYVLGSPIGRFGGSANTGWENKSGTFSNKWAQITSGDYQRGDIAFFNINGAIGHVGIVLEDKGSTVSIFDQNTGSGNGDGTGNNVCRIHDYPREQLKGTWRLGGEYDSDIKRVWKSNLSNPEFKQHFKDYNDTKLMTGADVRCLIDIALNR